MATGVFASKDVSHIGKLTGTNFAFWKFQLLLVLENQELDKVLDGTEVEPNELGADAERAEKEARLTEIKEWQKKDVACRNYIIATIDEKCQRSLMTCRTAQQMWTRLRSQYELTSQENKHLLLQKFMSYEFEEGNDVLNHITAVESLASQLADVGMQIPDAQVATKILMTLPPSYGPFISAWNNVKEEDKNVQTLTSRLQQEEALKRLNNMELSEAADAAFFTRQRGTGRKTAKKSHQTTASQEGSEGQMGKPKCEFCRKSNKKSTHSEEACWRKEAYLQGKRDATRELNEGKRDGTKASTALITTTAEPERETYFAFSARVAKNQNKRTLWYADSGATRHMTDQRDLFTKFRAIEPGNSHVYGIADTELEVEGIGDIPVLASVNGAKNRIIIKDALYVPRAGNNLISVGAATDQQMKVDFDDAGVKFIKKADGKVIATGTRDKVNSRLYLIEMTSEPMSKTANYGLHASHDDSLKVWHERLGHVNHRCIIDMARLNVVHGLTVRKSEASMSICHGCALGKHHRQPFPTNGRNRATRLGGLIHSDVCGPMQNKSQGGARYFVTFKDDFTGHGVIHFLRSKAEVFSRFKEYAAKIKSETGREIDILRTDNGGEYTSVEFESWLRANGITHQTSSARTPEQNGVAERYNRTIIESARSMILSSNLGQELWAEATACAVYLQNRVLTSSVEKRTPFEARFGRKPDLSHLRVFGCDAYAHVDKELRMKFDPKGIKCALVGYCENKKAYRLWDREARIIRISRDVIFQENVTTSDDIDEQHVINCTPRRNHDAPTQISIGSDEPSTDHTDKPALNEAPETFNPIATVHSHDSVTTTDEDGEPFHGFEEEAATTTRFGRRVTRPKRLIEEPNFGKLAEATEIKEPTTYQEAITSPQSSEWRDAMDEEMSSLRENKT